MALRGEASKTLFCIQNTFNLTKNPKNTLKEFPLYGSPLFNLPWIGAPINPWPGLAFSLKMRTTLERELCFQEIAF